MKRLTGSPTRAAFDALFDMVKKNVKKLRYWTGPVKSTRKGRNFKKGPKKFGPKREITEKDEFLLTMMKLRGTVWLPQEDMFTFTIKLELAKENLPSGDPGTFIPLKLKKRLILEQASRCIRSNGSWSSSPCEADDCNAGTMANWPWLG